MNIEMFSTDTPSKGDAEDTPICLNPFHGSDKLRSEQAVALFAIGFFLGRWTGRYFPFFGNDAGIGSSF